MVAERCDVSESIDANIIEEEVLTQLVGEDQYGRVKGYGLGVTPTQINGPKTQPRETMQREIEGMRKELEADYETRISDLKAEYEGKITELKEENERKLESVKSENERVQADMNSLRNEFLQFKNILSQV